ncbi:MAG: hypothetical protein HYS61_00520 [Acidobacteria bacterium]|nr:hypothetical protein [Acidobacteriota bacterium]
MGLIASVIEKTGIPTVCLTLLREVAVKVKPPRALFVPFPHGYPLGKPNEPELQHRILHEALKLLKVVSAESVLRDFDLH